MQKAYCPPSTHSAALTLGESRGTPSSMMRVLINPDRGTPIQPDWGGVCPSSSLVPLSTIHPPPDQPSYAGGNK